MNKQTEEFRKKIVETFIKSLEENPLEWKKSWQGAAGIPFNGASGRRYHGINRFLLQFASQEKGYDDPRWYTFNQVSSAELKVRKGSHGHKVEFWFLWDRENKRSISLNEYAKLSDEEKEKVTWTPRYYTVFNGSQIEGLAPYEIPKRDVNPSEVIQTISQNTGVEIVHDGGDQAFYRIAEDKVHLPLPEHFFSDYDYNATALHELAHSTGNEKRLNRQFGSFGDEKYAREELVAELTSCFMAAELPVPQSKEHLENHQAYIQSWISELKEKPESLMQAVKEAEKAATYLEKAGGLIKDEEEIQAIELQENEPEKQADKEQDTSKEIENSGEISLKEFLQSRGLETAGSDNQAKRSEAICEYYAKLRSGEIKAPETTERMTEITYGKKITQEAAVSKQILKNYDIRIKEGGKEMLYTDGMPGVIVGPHRIFTKDGCLNYYKDVLKSMYDGKEISSENSKLLQLVKSDLEKNAGFECGELEKMEKAFLKFLSKKSAQSEEKNQTARRRSRR